MAKAPKKKNIQGWIRTVYLYLISAITIIMVIVASVSVVRIGLDTYVFQIDRPAYWHNECMTPRVVNEGGSEMTDAELEACKERALEDAREQLAHERKRDVSEALAMLLVALPLYLYHWRVIQRDHT